MLGSRRRSHTIEKPARDARSDVDARHINSQGFQSESNGCLLWCFAITASRAICSSLLGMTAVLPCAMVTNPRKGGFRARVRLQSSPSPCVLRSLVDLPHRSVCHLHITPGPAPLHARCTSCDPATTCAARAMCVARYLHGSCLYSPVLGGSARRSAACVGPLHVRPQCQSYRTRLPAQLR